MRILPTLSALALLVTSLVSSCEQMSLTTLPIASQKVGYSPNGVLEVQVNNWYVAAPMTGWDGNTYEEYIVIHPQNGALGYAEYNLGGEYARFSASVGQARNNADLGHCGDNNDFGWTVRILADGIEIWSTADTVTLATDVQVIDDIDVTGVNVLRLETNSQGTYICDWPTFFNPMLGDCGATLPALPLTTGEYIGDCYPDDWHKLLFDILDECSTSGSSTGSEVIVFDIESEGDVASLSTALTSFGYTPVLFGSSDFTEDYNDYSGAISIISNRDTTNGLTDHQKASIAGYVQNAVGCFIEMGEESVGLRVFGTNNWEIVNPSGNSPSLTSGDSSKADASACTACSVKPFAADYTLPNPYSRALEQVDTEDAIYSDGTGVTVARDSYGDGGGDGGGVYYYLSKTDWSCTGTSDSGGSARTWRGRKCANLAIDDFLNDCSEEFDTLQSNDAAFEQRLAAVELILESFKEDEGTWAFPLDFRLSPNAILMSVVLLLVLTVVNVVLLVNTCTRARRKQKQYDMVYEPSSSDEL